MAADDLRRPGIYCIINITSSRVYVGSSINIYNRWKAHRSQLHAGEHSARAMQRSWIKHGEEAFEFSVLEFVEVAENLITREQFWINDLDCCNTRTGFNSAPTAGNCLGVKHSDATRQKLSDARKGKAKSPEHRAAIGAAHKGRPQSEKMCRDKSDRMKQYFIDNPERRERMREVGRRNGAASKGRKLSDQARANISASRAGNEACLAASQANFKIASAASIGAPRHAARTLTFEQAESIRSRKAEGATYAQLETEFTVTRAALFQIVKRRTYQRP